METLARQEGFGARGQVLRDGSWRVMALTAFVLLLAGASGEAADAGKGWRMGEFRDVSFKETPGVRAITLKPVEIHQVAVVRPRVRPGDQAELEAEYRVAAPSGELKLREVRIVEFNGVELARRERIVAARTGQVRTAVTLPVPEDAAPGGYTVVTIVSPVAATRGVSGEAQEKTIFYVVKGPAPPPLGPSAPPSPTAAQSVPDRPTGPAPGEPLRVELWAGKNEYRVGEKVAFYFQANRDAYVMLINKGTSGKVTILYPNPFTPEERIKANTRYAVPGPEGRYELTVAGPAGDDMVWAVASVRPIRSPAITGRSGDASVLPRDITLTAAAVPPEEQSQATVVLKVVE